MRTKRIIKRILTFTLVLLLCMQSLVFAAEDINQNNNTEFKDISKYGWAKEAINYLGQSGVISGDGKGNFQPGKNVTREEFATMLSNAFGSEFNENTVQLFSDVPSTRWSYRAIQSTKDYLTGYYPPKGKPFFDPAGDATREDVAVALAKMLELTEEDLVNPNILEESFTDSDEVSFNIRGIMSVVVEKKIMLGSNGLLRPTNPITKAEVASLLFKVMKSPVAGAGEALKLDVSIPETTASSNVYISGQTIAGAKVKVNGYDATVDSTGNFEVSFTLKKEGKYSIEVIAVKNGRRAIEKGNITYQEAASALNITKCPETSEKSGATIEGTISNADESSILTVNNEPVEFYKFNYNSDIYTFKYTASLKEGTNEFNIVLKDKKGKETTVKKTITYVLGAPELIVTQCPETSTSKTVKIVGTVKDKSDSNVSVYINNESVDKYSWSNSWSETVTLKEGKNVFVIKATNSNGKSTQITKEIIFTVGGPDLIITQCPETSTNKKLTISGTVKDGNDSNPSVYINNEIVNKYSWSSSWSKDVTLKEGKNTFVIKATNSNGKSTQITKEVVFTIGGPDLVITNCPETSDSKKITISGTVTDTNDSNPSVYVNNEPVSKYSWSSSWSKDVTLKEGKNTIIIKATNSNGKSTQITKEVVFTVGGPDLVVTYCPETSSSQKITISGTVSDNNDSNPSVYINNELVSKSSWSSSWNKTVTLKEGKNTFTIKATNSNGKSTEVTKEVVFTVAAPEITFTNCPEVTGEKNIYIQGSVSDPSGDRAKVYINDQEVGSSWSNSFSKYVTLSQGDNTFIVRAVNSFGKSQTVIKTIKYANIVPPVLNVNSVSESVQESSVTISGTVQDDLDPAVTVYVNDKLVSSSNGNWSVSVSLSEGENTIIIVATNKFSKSVTVVKKVKYTPAPAASTTPTTPTPDTTTPTPDTTTPTTTTTDGAITTTPN